MTDDQRPPEQPGAGDQPDQPDQPEQPAVEQPTTAWTPPEQPKPAWTPPPAAAPPTPPEPSSTGWTPPPADLPPTPSEPTTTGWTPPAQPTPAWTPPANATPPPTQPTDQPAPYSGGTGPLLSATPTPAVAAWTQPADASREVAPGLVFSGTAARFAAYLVDGFLLAVIGSVITSVLGTRGSFPQTSGFVWTAADFLATLLALAINGAYFIGFWSGGRRATLGQMLFKIQVGNAFDGRPLSLEQAVRRWLALGQFLSVFAISAVAIGAIGLLSLIWTLVLFISTVSSPTKQGLHDRFANSAVVRPANAGNGLVWACLIIVIAVPVVAFLAVIGLIMSSDQIRDILSQVGNSV
jgi:uncharacterized RDD family membrane protein YckC